MLPTVATQIARNSRSIGGGADCAPAAARRSKQRGEDEGVRMRSMISTVTQSRAYTVRFYQSWPSTTSPAHGRKRASCSSSIAASLTIGLVLMVINRLVGLRAARMTSKYLVDDIIGKHRADLLMPLAAIAAAATIVQARDVVRARRRS